MITYSLKLKPTSNFITPWQADTIFGSLCWIMVWRQGEAALLKFLAEYANGTPPLILSDAMPADWLPAPAHLSLCINPTVDIKLIKKVQWLTYTDFNFVRTGNYSDLHIADLKPFKPIDTLHGSISRASGTTRDEGSLFELEEFAFDSEAISSDYLTVYLRIKENRQNEMLSLFNDLSVIGYGAKRSTGKGSFEIIGRLEECNKFDSFEGANGFMSLSNFIPAKNDPTYGFYKTMVKYGKLSGNFANSKNPFKKPLLMFEKGAVFKCGGEIMPYYGRMVEEISPLNTEIKHYAYAFAVPIKFPSL